MWDLFHTYQHFMSVQVWSSVHICHQTDYATASVARVILICTCQHINHVTAGVGLKSRLSAHRLCHFQCGVQFTPVNRLVISLSLLQVWASAWIVCRCGCTTGTCGGTNDVTVSVAGVGSSQTTVLPTNSGMLSLPVGLSGLTQLMPVSSKAQGSVGLRTPASLPLLQVGRGLVVVWHCYR